jgi:hypothetical protein
LSSKAAKKRAHLVGEFQRERVRLFSLETLLERELFEHIEVIDGPVEQEEQDVDVAVHGRERVVLPLQLRLERLDRGRRDLVQPP